MIMRSHHIDAEDISIEVKSGEVIFTGTVESKEAKRMLEDMAEAVLGVKDVRNELRVSRQQGQNQREQNQHGQHQQGQSQSDNVRQGRSQSPSQGEADSPNLTQTLGSEKSGSGSNQRSEKSSSKNQ